MGGRQKALEELLILEEEHEARARHLEVRHFQEGRHGDELSERNLAFAAIAAGKRREQVLRIGIEAAGDETPERHRRGASRSHAHPVQRKHPHLVLVHAKRVGYPPALRRELLRRAHLVQQRYEVEVGGRVLVIVAEGQVIGERTVDMRIPEAAERQGARPAETARRGGIGHALGRPDDRVRRLDGDGFPGSSSRRLEQEVFYLAQPLPVRDVVEQRLHRVVQRLGVVIPLLEIAKRGGVRRPPQRLPDASRIDVERKRPVQGPVAQTFERNRVAGFSTRRRIRHIGAPHRRHGSRLWSLCRTDQTGFRRRSRKLAGRIPGSRATAVIPGAASSSRICRPSAQARPSAAICSLATGSPAIGRPFSTEMPKNRRRWASSTQASSRSPSAPSTPYSRLSSESWPAESAGCT